MKSIERKPQVGDKYQWTILTCKFIVEITEIFTPHGTAIAKVIDVEDNYNEHVGMDWDITHWPNYKLIIENQDYEVY